ncbi:MBL fold metallo-hydrolase [Lentiprolixibacter aurantiacus]|uniref:MBL fold metallo-hydrolase n=1 Tax=Lentiprolixibacter aurantiacus TaxID=2993939 RepID=A0AAE3MM80_9FLAO|nr:MBL fold metallo-hydrolase [Lentiprolixibacter aurantiacus]MCX2719454.1 MBL fold metallo-hydrolase [Lentiprolixibacter aurantiacus]
MKYFTIICLVLLCSCKQNAKTEKSDAVQGDNAAQTETEALKIYPVEHATAVLKWGEHTLYIDPVGGADRFKGYPKPDLILITDFHGDHFNVETLEGLDTGKAKIIVPQAVADELPETFATQVDVLSNGDEKERFGITVEAIPMYNLREEALKFHVKGRGNGYVLSKDGMRLYFSGDTEDIPEMRALQDIDKAFVCMNLPYTMTVESAADAVLEFKPREVYPYHFRGNPDVSDVARFKELVAAGDPEIKVVQLDWYPNLPF